MYGGAYGLSALVGGDGYDEFGAALIGATIGEVAGVAAGTHFANGSRGDAFATFTASGVGAIVGAMLASKLDRGDHDWLALPLVQLPLTAGIQHVTARARARRNPDCSAVAAPSPPI